MSEILEFLSKHRSQMLKDLEQLVRAESPSHSKEAVDKCGEIIQQLFLQHLGLHTEVIPQYVAGNHLKLAYGDGPEQILILGHFDTVWNEGRLFFRLDGNKAYGPGILDMKGGIIQSLWAVKALKELGLKLNHRIIFLLTSDEEIGSPTSRIYIEAEAKKSKAVLVPEAAEAKTGALKTARKGVGVFKLKVKGVAAHAGNHHEIGISAIQELAQQILALHSLTDYEKGTTVNVGVIKGGTRSNVVAGEAEAEVDVRVATLAEARRIEQILCKLEPKLRGCTLTVSGGMNRPPLQRTAAIGEMYGTVRSIAASLGFDLDEAAVGGGSDGNFTAALGIPTLDGLGCVGDGPHAENEHIDLTHLAPRAALFAHLLVHLGQG